MKAARTVQSVEQVKAPRPLPVRLPRRATEPGADLVDSLEGRCSCGGGCPDCAAEVASSVGLVIGPPDDAFEHEAEGVAERVLAGLPLDPILAASSPTLQRACSCGGSHDEDGGECEERKELQLQRKAAGPAPLASAPRVVEQVLSSPGRSLEGPLRGAMEAGFGRDFSDVRVHTDAQAAESARAVNARAYTVEQEIVFATGRYAPETSAGRRLLAHELCHVLQQAGVSRGGPGGSSERLQRLTEEEKDEDLKSAKFAGQPRLERAFDNSPPLGIGESGEAVRLVQEQLVDDPEFAMPESTKPDGELDGEFGGETFAVVEQFQRKHGLGVDGRVGRETMGKLDELAAAAPPLLPQAGPPGPAVPQTSTDAAAMNGANVRAINMVFDAWFLVTRLRDLVNRGVTITDPADVNTLRAVQQWLHLDVAGLAGFLSAVDRAIALMEQNMLHATRLARRRQSHPDCQVTPGTIASSRIGDRAGVINFCETFFHRGPQCQRNVATHERFHLAGIGHGELEGRAPPEAPAARTTDQALNHADDMTDLAKDATGQPIIACDAGL
jgi:peptidoglycan hydrolase-like protein with peptidoglycan-binding domain